MAALCKLNTLDVMQLSMQWCCSTQPTLALAGAFFSFFAGAFTLGAAFFFSAAACSAPRQQQQQQQQRRQHGQQQHGQQQRGQLPGNSSS
jgi:hypothetical protein